MLETLLQWDAELFLWLHHNVVAGWADVFFPFITNLNKTWGFKFVAVPLIVASSLYFFRRWGIFFLLCMIISVAMSDMVGSQIMKPAFDRPRPNVAGLDVNLKSHHYGGKSFPSNHSANMFALATFLSLIFRFAPRGAWACAGFFTFAGLVAYSRIYVGVHYPLDITAGAALGIACGFTGYWFLKAITLRYGERMQLRAPLWLKFS